MDEIEQDEIIEDTEEETEETTEETKEEPKETKETPEAKLARIEREAKQLRKKLGKEEPEVKTKVEAKKESKTDGLDETQLDYLDLKGISDQDDIDLIEKIMNRTGQSLREVLKDDYVTSKLEANKKDREVKEATPSGTKRSGNQTSDASAVIARFEATGQMPDDFASREIVVDFLVKKDRSNAPSWHK